MVQLKNTFHKRQTELYFSTDIVPGTIVSYLAYFPEDYYRDSTRNFPILTILNGQGEKAYPPNAVSTSYDKLRRYGPAKLIEQGKEFPFVVITPQCGFAGWDEHDTIIDGAGKLTLFKGRFVNEIVKYMQRKYHVDPSRNYISGLSLGGGGTFSYFQHFPNKVAAAAPIAGWGNPTTACNTKEVPLWIFHNANDGEVKPDGDKEYVKSLLSCNPAPATPVKYTWYEPGYGHGGWNETYDNFGKDNLYDWFLTHVKGNPLPEDGSNKSPLVYGGPDLTFKSTQRQVILEGKASDADGRIVSYEWTQVYGQKVALEGASTNSLILKNMTNGMYTFRLTAKDNGDRTAFDEVMVVIRDGSTDIVTEVDQSLAEASVLVSPNPFIDHVSVSIPENVTGNVALTLSDIHGRVVYADKAVNKNMFDLNEVQALSKGIYFLQIVLPNGKNQAVKLMKE